MLSGAGDNLRKRPGSPGSSGGGFANDPGNYGHDTRAAETVILSRCRRGAVVAWPLWYCMPGGHPDVCRDWLPLRSAAPAIDEAHIGSGSDAQLGGALAHGGVRPGLVLCQALAGVPGQQVSAPGSDMGKFSERGGLALRGGRASGMYARSGPASAHP